MNFSLNDGFAAASSEATVKKGPIRPIGFVSLQSSSLVAYSGTIVLLAACAFSVWYFNELRKYDWLSRINRVEQVMFDLGELLIEEQLPNADWLGYGGAMPPARSSSEQADREYFSRLLGWLPTVYWALWAVAIVELATFLFWQGTAHRNLSALGSEGVRFHFLKSIVWWFVPIAVLWMP